MTSNSVIINNAEQGDKPLLTETNSLNCIYKNINDIVVDKEMSTKIFDDSKFNPDKIKNKDYKINVLKEWTFKEHIDLNILTRIVDNLDILKDKIGLGWDRKTNQRLDWPGTQTVIINYYKQIRKGGLVEYKPSNKSKKGRHFSKTTSLQGISRPVRHTVTHDEYIDIDMTNAHPFEFVALCKTYNFDCSHVLFYIENREKCLASLMEWTCSDRDWCKQTVLSLLNGGDCAEIFHYLGVVIPDSCKWISDFKTQVEAIHQNFFEHPAFADHKKELIKQVGQNAFNFNGKLVNKVLCEFENILIQHAMNYCYQKGIEIGANCFDGLLLKKSETLNDEFIKSMEDYVVSEVGIPVKFVIKEMDQGFDISGLKTNTEKKEMKKIEKENLKAQEKFEKEQQKKKDVVFDIDFDYVYELPEIHIEDYFYNDFFMEKNSTVFENLQDLVSFFKQRFPLVMNRVNLGKGIYIKKDTDEFCNNPVPIMEFYGLPFYHKNYKGDRVSVTLGWLFDFCNIKSYSNIVCKPNNHVRENELNLWVPFVADKRDSIKPNIDLLKPLFDYIKDILCCKDEHRYKYLITWLRSICKHPEKKTLVVPVFISIKHRAGKGSFINWFSNNVLGKAHVYATSLKKLVGNFNGFLLNKSLIIVDELPTTQQTYHSYFDTLKNLITEPTLDIEYKGKESFSTNNLLNFIFSTNNPHCIKIEQSDNRYAIYYIDESRVGDHDFWNFVHTNVFTQEVAEHFFSYLVNMPDDDDMIVSLRKIPMTETKRKMIEKSYSSMELFIKLLKERNVPDDLTIQLFGNDKWVNINHIPEQTIQVSKNALYTCFKSWCSSSGETLHRQRYFNDLLDEKRTPDKNRSRYFEI